MDFLATPTAAMSALEIRHLARSGAYSGHTAGLAPGRVQANLMILPEAQASDFMRFCQRNPKSCPVLAVSEPGNPLPPGMGEDLDIRTDLPRYRVWQDGMVVAEPQQVVDVWRDDLVTFLIGCSFSFEWPLLVAGIPLRHISQGCNVAMYRTHIPTVSAGPFHGPMVVSMRPMKATDAIRAIQITSRYPSVHGAPIHMGDPELIGIHDLSQPDFGDPVAIEDDELPVFWACGVTPQSVVMSARPAFCITHSPGCMLVTDLTNEELASF